MDNKNDIDNSKTSSSFLQESKTQELNPDKNNNRNNCNNRNRGGRRTVMCTTCAEYNDKN